MRQEKQLLLDDLKERVEKSDAFVITRHEKLTAIQAEELRGSFAEANADYEVVRKRVFVKAAQAAGVDGIEADQLEGSIGVVFAKEDPVATAKAVFKFCDENKERLYVLGGHFDGQMVSSDQVEALSKLPSKDELRSQFLGLLEAPMSQTLATMEAILTSVMHCMENKVSKETGEE